MTTARIGALLAQAPVVDGHNDLAWRLRTEYRYDLDLDEDLSVTGLHTDIPRLRAGGIGAQFWSVFVPCALEGTTAVSATLEQIDAVRHLVARYHDTLAPAT